MRTLRTDFTARLETENERATLSPDKMMALYFGGEMETGVAMAGQVAGRITSVEPVRDILRTTWDDCKAVLRALGARAES
jgi:enoyl-[acyl-carrier protein] reductase II